MVLDFIMFFKFQTLNLYYFSLISLFDFILPFFNFEFFFFETVVNFKDLFQFEKYNFKLFTFFFVFEIINKLNLILYNFLFSFLLSFKIIKFNYFFNYFFNDFLFFYILEKKNYFNTLFYLNYINLNIYDLKNINNNTENYFNFSSNYIYFLSINFNLFFIFNYYFLILNKIYYYLVVYIFLFIFTLKRFNFKLVNYNNLKKNKHLFNFNFFITNTNLYKNYKFKFFFFNFKNVKNNYFFFNIFKVNGTIYLIILFLIFNKLTWFNLNLIDGFTNYFFKIYSIEQLNYKILNNYEIFPIFSPTRASILLHVITLYWIYTWFVLNWKRAQFGRFSRKMKKIWFKILTMIWMAEILLFITFFTCAIFIMQNPTAYYIEYKNIKSLQLSYVWVFTRMWKLAVVLWICNFIRINLRWLEWKKIIFISFIISLYILKLGFHDWYFLTHHAGWCKQNRLFIKGKCDIHYRFILIIFRIFHTYLIGLGWFFFIYRSINKKKIRYSMLTANIQNIFYLTLLTYTMQIYLIRDSLFDYYYSPSSKYTMYLYDENSIYDFFLKFIYIFLLNLV